MRPYIAVSAGIERAAGSDGRMAMPVANLIVAAQIRALRDGCMDQSGPAETAEAFINALSAIVSPEERPVGYDPTRPIAAGDV